MNSVSSPLYTPAPAWTGRDDGPGTEHARWHSQVQRLDLASQSAAIPRDSVVLLGFASDEGVLRNGGRQGAAQGPGAIRTALGSLAIHEGPLGGRVYDAGTITTQDDDLEQAHDELSKATQRLCESNNLTVVLGGGHETAFGSHRGAYHGLKESLQIVNLDAHFDLRGADRATSGTPFKQLADLYAEEANGTIDPPQFAYTVLGISRPNNTKVLFDTAAGLGVHVLTDEELLSLTPAQAADAAVSAIEGHPQQKVHLSIDLDVLPADCAPGVSAPAGLGVPLPHIHAMAVAIARTGRLGLVDVVELNPSFDIDARTAKVAARLINDIAQAHLDSTS